MCSCGCTTKTVPEKTEAAAEKKTFVCIQCNTFKTVPAGDPVPECCGKRMSDMD